MLEARVIASYSYTCIANISTLRKDDAGFSNTFNIAYQPYGLIYLHFVSRLILVICGVTPLLPLYAFMG